MTKFVKRRPSGYHGVTVKFTCKTISGKSRVRIAGIWFKNDTQFGYRWDEALNFLATLGQGKITVPAFRAAVQVTFPEACVKLP